jgi:hypothetical protein
MFELFNQIIPDQDEPESRKASELWTLELATEIFATFENKTFEKSVLGKIRRET